MAVHRFLQFYLVLNSPLRKASCLAGEGCEWAEFRHLATNSPLALQQVGQLNIELHLATTLGLRHMDSLNTLLGHVAGHKFRAVKAHANLGDEGDQYRVLPSLTHAGFPTKGCCCELHLLRDRLVAPGAAPFRQG